MRTSQDFPLQIDSVKIPDTGGRLGITFCPGKKQTDAATGSWHRDLQLDFQAIQSWGAAVIVNFLQDDEMLALKVEDTAQYLPAGICYLRMPIPDFGVPDATWEANWQAQRSLLINTLQEGESVLLHCKGGLGRAGTISARLLIEMGWLPEQAIRAVRQARPGAIENSLQENYLRALAAP